MKDCEEGLELVGAWLELDSDPSPPRPHGKEAKDTCEGNLKMSTLTLTLPPLLRVLSSYTSDYGYCAI